MAPLLNMRSWHAEVRLYFVFVFVSRFPAVLQAESRSHWRWGVLTLGDQHVLVAGTLGQRTFPVVILEVMNA